jgi:hypothetical protein
MKKDFFTELFEIIKEAEKQQQETEKHLKKCRRNFYRKCNKRIDKKAIHAGINDILMKAGI